jgi:hypothetical protein
MSAPVDVVVVIFAIMVEESLQTLTLCKANTESQEND